MKYIHHLLITGAVLAGSSTAMATINVIPNPGATTSEIGARIRWGSTGFEASVYDSNPLNQSPTLNPYPTPVWTVGTPYKFQVSFDQATGVLGLGVDFNGDNSFGAGETISRSAFLPPGLASYAGYGFKYLYISGNEGGSTARSEVTNLKINGDSVPNLAPNGLFIQEWYKESSGLMGNVTIEGSVTFLTAGTSDQRPSWDFAFRSAEIPAAVPEPSTYFAGAMLLAPFAVSAIKSYRRNRKS